MMQSSNVYLVRFAIDFLKKSDHFLIVDMPPHILRCVHSKNRNCFLGVNPLTFNNNVRNALDFQVNEFFYFTKKN
jgi:hypothetical protein